MNPDTLPRVVPAELPSYEVTATGILLLAEYGRRITVGCDRCGTELPLRLLSDEILPEDRCNALLTDYLTDLGWTGDGSPGNTLCRGCS